MPVTNVIASSLTTYLTQSSVVVVTFSMEASELACKLREPTKVELCCSGKLLSTAPTTFQLRSIQLTKLSIALINGPTLLEDIL